MPGTNAGDQACPMIGTTVSHYRILSHIGAGGMGTVYLAEDTNLKRHVALKFLSPGTIHDPEAAARLLREARAGRGSRRSPARARWRSSMRCVVEAWRRLLYTFDHADLHAKIEAVNDSSREWRVEKVSYAAAYGDERMLAYLFLPKNAKPPYQVMVSCGSAGLYERSSTTTNDFDGYTFIVRSGRALLYPIYKSMFERADGLKADIPDTTTVWRDHVIMWSKDMGRSIDYLESRADIAKGKIGHIALSSDCTPLTLAVEPRISLAVIYCGGFARQESLPEVDPLNFAPLVKVPVLMLNGRYDYYYPTASSQEPHFNLLGTPAEHKRRVVYESSHMIPRNETIKEVVNWMEKYWGANRHADRGSLAVMTIVCETGPHVSSGGPRNRIQRSAAGHDADHETRPSAGQRGRASSRAAGNADGASLLHQRQSVVGARPGRVDRAARSHSVQRTVGETAHVGPADRA
jgi:hypothetical protein